MALSFNLILSMVYEPYRQARKRLFRPFDKHANWRTQAKLLGLSQPARNRLTRIIYYETTAHRNALATCRHFGIAPKVFYTWKNRFDGKNLRVLEDRSKRPSRTRTKQITSEEERRIIALRKAHLRWGKMKIRRLYHDTYGCWISSWKIQYTIQQWKLYFHPKQNAQLRAKRQRSQAKKRITELTKQPFPGFLIALDCIVLYRNGLKRYILTAVDAVAKIAFARMYTAKSSRSAADFLRRMYYLLDGAILNGGHDNGSEFHKEFITACQELGITQWWSRVKTPTDNPMNERFNRTLKDEYLAFGNFRADPVEFNRELTKWLIEYNFVRPHQSLGYDTPWQWYQKTAKVLPMSPSRTKA